MFNCLLDVDGILGFIDEQSSTETDSLLAPPEEGRHNFIKDNQGNQIFLKILAQKFYHRVLRQ